MPSVIDNDNDNDTIVSNSFYSKEYVKTYEVKEFSLLDQKCL